jgi:hypothetical protein
MMSRFTPPGCRFRDATTSEAGLPGHLRWTRPDGSSGMVRYWTAPDRPPVISAKTVPEDRAPTVEELAFIAKAMSEF